ncbi:hypothetical protein CALCODRAFT_260340 [Calocera cornea HHB12733]|uniref:Uncharacterized protein n=1 Tax=Calocera cornea HHB12733 TaxID=1353952 RepID=A0A165GIA8_9BASI|nr:hypothetical protein CALCODRAFT_260340 [Calocera cornea HHB12733]
MPSNYDTTLSASHFLISVHCHIVYCQVPGPIIMTTIPSSTHVGDGAQRAHKVHRIRLFAAQSVPECIHCQPCTALLSSTSALHTKFLISGNPRLAYIAVSRSDPLPIFPSYRWQIFRGCPSRAARTSGCGNVDPSMLGWEMSDTDLKAENTRRPHTPKQHTAHYALATAQQQQQQQQQHPHSSAAACQRSGIRLRQPSHGPPPALRSPRFLGGWPGLLRTAPAPRQAPTIQVHHWRVSAHVLGDPLARDTA